MPLRLSALLLLALSLFACHAAEPARSGSATLDLSIAPETRARAAEILEVARAREPGLTQELQALAIREQVRLHGLQHRLKTQKSLARKIQTYLVQGKAASLSEVVINDSLRYTFLIEEEPPGHYNQVARTILSTLESSGYRVIQVKNYWPRGDSYAGLNCVLLFSDGFPWELQFHTMGSLVAKQEGHELYKTMRLPTTGRRERRRIFDRLTERWNWVLIPEGILVPLSVHSTEVLKKYSRP